MRGTVGYAQELTTKTYLRELAERGNEYHAIKVERGNEQSASLRDIEFRYVSWLSEKTSLVFSKSGEILEFLAPKRGNPAYTRRAQRRFTPIELILSENYFGYGASPFVWVTLTYSRDTDIATAWRKVGVDWNKFITNMRNKFKGIRFVRCFEAQKGGYPHIHALLWFKERHFPYFAHKKTYRICDEATVESMRSCWKAGYSDFQAFKSGKYAASYLVKYITKQTDDSDNPRSRLNFALQWFYHKRSFSISGEISKLSKAFDLTRGQLPISNSDPSELPEKALFLGLNTPSGFISADSFKVKRPTSEKMRRFEENQAYISALHDFFKSCWTYHLLRRAKHLEFNRLRLRPNGHLPL